MRYSILLLLTLIISGSVFAQQDAEEGKLIFRSRCASCHAVDRRLVGPALQNVYDRRDNKWIIDFVHSSQTVIKKGDADAVALFEEYNKTIMPDHKDLSEAQINNILAYIKQQGEQAGSKKTGTAAYVPPYVRPYENKNSFIDKIVYLNFDEKQSPIKKDDFMSWFLIAVIIAILLILLYVLVFFNTIMTLYGSGAAIKAKQQPTKEEHDSEDQP